VVDERGDDGEGDVGLEQGEANLAQGLGDVLVGDGALAAEGLEGALEFVGEGFEHAEFKFTGCPAGRAHCAWGGHFVTGIPDGAVRTPEVLALLGTDTGEIGAGSGDRRWGARGARIMEGCGPAERSGEARA